MDSFTLVNSRAGPGACRAARTLPSLRRAAPAHLPANAPPTGTKMHILNTLCRVAVVAGVIALAIAAGNAV